MKGNINTNFSILNWNKGNSHFSNKKDTIEHILQVEKPDIFTIQELNILESDDINKMQFPGYKLEIDQLILSHGRARAGIIIKETINYTRLNEIETKGEPVIWIELHLPGNKKIRIQNYYRQWREIDKEGKGLPGTETQRSQNIRFQKISQIWSQQLENHEVISLSDTNIDLSKNFFNSDEISDSDKKLTQIYKMMQDNIFNKGASLIKTLPTKIYDKKMNTYIDHLITNYPQKILDHKVLPYQFSDHLMVNFTVSNKTKIHNPKYRLVRKFSKINWDQLNLDLANYLRIQSASTDTDANMICEKIMDSIQEHMDTQEPRKRIQIDNKIPDFTSTETKIEMKNRDEASAIAKTTFNDDDIRKWKTLRNRVNKMLTKDKQDAIKKEHDEAEGDTRRQWKITKQQAGWNKQLSPTILSHEGKTIRDPRSIANVINKAQISRNTRLHREVPKTDIDHRTNYKKLTKDKHLSFTIRNISMHEIKQSISEMRGAPSAGVDGLSVKTMKRILKPLYPALLNLVNTSINTATYPDRLKLARIVPLRKGNKCPTDPLSYRAVNILPSLGKIIDRLLNKQITRHLVSNNLILQQHHGSIKGRSTMTAVACMLDEWVESLEKGESNTILILDQSAAYDVICHRKLIEKMIILGFDNNAIEFFKNYLSGRRQSVTVDSFQSDELYSGPLSVCQGSTLSGLLYLIYTLDYPLIFFEKNIPIEEYDITRKPKTTTFVDDSIVKILMDDDLNNHNEQIKTTLSTITQYMNANSLVLNRDKTKLLVIAKTNEIRENIKLEIEGKTEPIKPVRSIIYLGIHIQDDLRWNQFLSDGPENLTKKLRQKLNAIRCLRKYLSMKTTKMLLNGIFMSTLLYGACLWLGCQKYLIERIQKLQLDACRLTLGHKAIRWSKTRLLKEMNWLAVEKLLERENHILTHKIINTKSPLHLYYKMCVKYNTTNTRETRRTGKGKLGNAPKEIGKTKKMNYHYRMTAYKNYQKLPDELTQMKDPQKL